MPFSTSIVLPTGFPSSSTLMAPRAAASVPSSTMLTNLFATGLPIRSEKMEIPLRLKSASMPWPIASCRRIPDAPAPRTTGISPAGGVTASKRTTVRETASLTIRSSLSGE